MPAAICLCFITETHHKEHYSPVRCTLKWIRRLLSDPILSESFGPKAAPANICLTLRALQPNSLWLMSPLSPKKQQSIPGHLHNLASDRDALFRCRRPGRRPPLLFHWNLSSRPQRCSYLTEEQREGHSDQTGEARKQRCKVTKYIYSLHFDCAWE